MQPEPPPPRPAGGDSRKLLEDLHSYVGVVRRGWRLIGLGVVVALTAAGIFLARSKPTYRASARLLVIQQGGRPIQVAGAGDPFQGVPGANDSLATHLMIIKSPVVAERAAAESGVGSVSAASILQAVTVKLPDPSARVIEIGYTSQSRDESSRVMGGLIRSYNRFLKDNYQKNTNEVVALIVRVRDELSLDLKKLEQEYLEYRQKNPAYSADEKGRTFIVRRLDQWDQAMNQVLVRALQLKSQLALGRKLSAEGADPATVTNALNQLGALSGGSPVAAQASIAAAVGGQSLERVAESLDAVEAERQTAEQMLGHLRRQQEELDATDRVTEREIRQAFLDDPEVTDVQNRLRSARARLADRERLARSPSDASVADSRRRVRDLEGEYERLWKALRPTLADRLARQAGGGLAETVRSAEVDLLGLKAKEAALRERLGEVAAAQLEGLRQERERLGPSAGPQDPRGRQIDERVAHVERLRDRPATGPTGDGKPGALLASIERSLEAVEMTRADLQKRFDEDLDASKRTEISQLAENNLRQNLDRQRTLFNSVVDQLKQAQLVSDYNSVAAQTITPPAVAAERPNPFLILALAAVAGVTLGVASAFGVDLLDARVRTLAEIRALVDLPVIGLIPQMAADQLSATVPVGLLCHETPRSALAESYKSTRTNLDFLRRNRRAQVLLISSPHPGDGKSTTSSNLAITLAHAGRRVLLIDADLRKPSLHAIYGRTREGGLSDVLEGRDPFASVVRPTFVDNLDLLTTGADTPNPAELLASDALARLFDELRQKYDVVVVDSSPLLAITDPSIIAAVVDGILLVVRITSTRRYDIERTAELLKTLHIPVFGMVVNGLLRNQFGYGYGYGRYGYGYGYGGYGYGQGQANGAGGGNGNGRAGAAVLDVPGPTDPLRNGRGPNHFPEG